MPFIDFTINNLFFNFIEAFEKFDISYKKNQFYKLPI